MNTWIDHLNAVLAGGGALLILLGVSVNGQSTSRDAVAQDAGRSALADAAAWIERDLDNAGAGLAPGERAIEALAWTGPTRAFTFRTVSDTAATATAQRVTYRLEPVGARFRLVRLVETPAGPRAMGQTPPTLRRADVALLDSAGQAVGASGRVRHVRIALAMDPPLGGVPLVWARRFSPPNLAR